MQMHQRSVIGAAAVVLAVAASTTTAWAAWGCKATANNGKQQSITWGASDENDARAYTLQLCNDTPGYKGCAIADCRPEIGTQAQSQAAWPTQNLVKCIGNAKC